MISSLFKLQASMPSSSMLLILLSVRAFSITWLMAFPLACMCLRFRQGFPHAETEIGSSERKVLIREMTAYLHSNGDCSFHLY